MRVYKRKSGPADRERVGAMTGTGRASCTSGSAALRVHRGRCLAVAAGVVCLLAAGGAGGPEAVRHHGFRLDERHLLLLEQRHREIEIGIATRSRNIGDTARTRTRDESSETAGRFETGEAFDLGALLSGLG